MWVSYGDGDGAPQLNGAGRALVEVLRHTPHEHGLARHLWEAASGRAGLETELALSDALVRYADAMGGAARLEGEVKRAAIVELLGVFFDGATDIGQLERVVEPAHPQYRALLRVYATYRDAPELEPLSRDLLHLDGEGLQRQMVAVAKRLRALGYWVDGGADWGAHFVTSLHAFQRGHDLRETGVVDAGTLDALNMPASMRRKRVEQALAAWREVRPARDEHYVLVNIPDMHGEVWEGGERELRFRIIVGAGKHVYDAALGERVYQGKTPRFSDVIEIIEFNPYWWIPDGIVAEELNTSGVW